MLQDIWVKIQWALIEFYLWLRSKVFGENDHFKSFKEPDALSRRYGFKCIIGIRDFQYWDTVPVFSPQQAACLISGYSPGFYRGDYPPEVDAIMIDLIRFYLDSSSDFDTSFIKRCKSKRLEKILAPSFELKRGDLIDYCDVNQLEPLFLYPEKRDQQSSTEIELAKIKEELAKSRHANEELKSGGQSPYLDRKHPLFSEELYITISTWQELFSSGEDIKKKGKAPTGVINKWLGKNQKKLSKSARARIQTVCNPDIYKQGGAPPTEIS